MSPPGRPIAEDSSHAPHEPSPLSALQLLGPMQVLSGGCVQYLSVRKWQALLLVLALDGPTQRQRLCALLWPNLDEASSRRNLRRELVRLRQAVAAALLHSEGEVLRLARGVRTDYADFELAVDEGRAEEAVALWRGPLADGLNLDDAPPFAEWLSVQRERAAQLKQRALQAAQQAHEAQGRPEQALACVQALLADDALQEHRQRDAMRLLAACGRREAALAQYERCVALLRSELGLQPMAETVGLYQSLLGQEAVVQATTSNAQTKAFLSTPVASVAALPAAGPLTHSLAAPLPFVGRENEVARLEAGWAQGHSLLIEGDGGMGKTRLALDFVMAHGPHLLVRSRTGDADLAYATFARALRLLIGPLRDSADLAQLAPWIRIELARLVPELGPAPAALNSAAERLRFTEACCQAWLTLGSDNFDAVVFDDWQHADPSSRQLLDFIAGRRREQRLSSPREVLVFRPAVVEPGALPAPPTSADTTHVQLLALAPAAVLHMVQQLSGLAQPTLFAQRLSQATAGNPFFIAETLRHLAELHLLQADEQGIWHTPFDDATQDYRELPLPASVRDAVLARVARLDPACLRILQAAALAQEPFAPALLASACALSELEAVLAFEQAARAQLLRPHELGAYAFSHDLVQQALESSLDADRRRLLHHRLALAALALGEAPARIAWHFEWAGQAARAVAHRLAAGDAAAALYAHTQALMHWQKGLQDGPSQAQRVSLLSRQLPQSRWLDQAAQAQRQAQELRLLLDAVALDDGQRSEALLALARDESRHGSSAASLACLDALPAPQPPAQRTQLAMLRMDALHGLGRIDEAMAIGTQALAWPAMPLGERADLLFSLALVHHAGGHMAAGAALLEQYLALGQRLDDDLRRARGQYLLGSLRLELGDLSGSAAALAEAAQASRRIHNVHIQRLSLLNLASVRLSQALPQEALAIAQQGWDLHQGQAPDEISVMFRTRFLDTYLTLGDLGGALDQARCAAQEVLPIAQQVPMAAVLLTGLEAFALTGTLAQAQALMDAIDINAMRQMPQVAHEMWLVRAEVALHSHDTHSAGLCLAEVGASATIENERIRARALQIRAHCALAQGQAAAALTQLPDDQASGMTDELRLRARAVRIAALARMGPLAPAERAAAAALLAAPGAHAVAALLLYRALADAAKPPMDAAAKALRLAHQQHLQRMLASLEGQAAAQAHLRRCWG